MHEITVSRQFTAAHALRLADGTREPVHEHDWDVRVTVAADELDAIIARLQELKTKFANYARIVFSKLSS